MRKVKKKEQNRPNYPYIYYEGSADTDYGPAVVRVTRVAIGVTKTELTLTRTLTVKDYCAPGGEDTDEESVARCVEDFNQRFMEEVGVSKKVRQNARSAKRKVSS